MPRKKGFNEIVVEEHPEWSPTRLDLAELCMKSYWFQYIKRIPHTINSSIARGKLLHRIIENFWKIDETTNSLTQGYSSYESFVNSAVRDWKFQFAKTSESDGQKIEWDFKGQQWSPRFIGDIANTAGRIYSRYIAEEPRLASEFEIKGKFEGIKIFAKIDELRKEIVIRDHKSGYKKHGEFYLKNNIQMTAYMMCVFCALQEPTAKISKIYPEFIGISLDEFLEIASIEIHDVSAKKEGELKEPRTIIYPAKRREQDFIELTQTIKIKEKQLRERDFHPTKGKHCDYCFYKKNCDDYNPVEEHKNELERNAPLFAYAGLDMNSIQGFKDSYNPKIKRPRRQKIMRYKYE